MGPSCNVYYNYHGDLFFWYICICKEDIVAYINSYEIKYSSILYQWIIVHDKKLYHMILSLKYNI